MEELIFSHQIINKESWVKMFQTLEIVKTELLNHKEELVKGKRIAIDLTAVPKTEKEQLTRQWGRKFANDAVKKCFSELSTFDGYNLTVKPTKKNGNIVMVSIKK